MLIKSSIGFFTAEFAENTEISRDCSSMNSTYTGYLGILFLKNYERRPLIPLIKSSPRFSKHLFHQHRTFYNRSIFRLEADKIYPAGHILLWTPYERVCSRRLWFVEKCGEVCCGRYPGNIIRKR